MPRKKPFSGKQKKVQLQNKKLKKTGDFTLNNSHIHSTSKKKVTTKPPLKKGEYDPNRYKLNFLRETPEEISARKLKSQTEQIKFVEDEDLEISIEDVHPNDAVLELPQRPQWSNSMSKFQLEANESSYFTEYLQKIHKENENRDLSYFEHNLETWRQVWRVLEKSDVVVMVTDVRHPILHFSPALYNHVTKDLKKPLILVLNKVDLIPASVSAAWSEYFKKLFPDLRVVFFTSFPSEVRRVDHGKKVRRRPNKKRIYRTQLGPEELLDHCKEIFQDRVDLSSWQQKIRECQDDVQKSSSSKDVEYLRDHADGDHLEDNPHHQFITLGFVGHPNVGKSSLMNGLMGRKVVSTSITPGHTKYFQTYFLTKTVRLCDCPGLVFPSLIDKRMQILSGIYPISQVQEPYTSVGYLASRLPIVDILKLPPSDLPWTPWTICEAWAIKKNYMTAKASRPDVYRAANSILRMAVDGRLCLWMRPPGYTANKESWDLHKVTKYILSLQISGHKAETINSSDLESDLEEEEDEEDGSGEVLTLKNTFQNLLLS